MPQRFALSCLALLTTVAVSLAAANTTVVLEFSGQFSANANDIVIANHPTGSFPIPGLIGGTFSGSAEYRSDASGVLIGIRQFPFSATRIKIFDNTASQIYTITQSANQLFVGPHEASFNLGASGDNQQGWLPRMPTDLRFKLLNNAFDLANTTPPSAAALNASSLYSGPIPGGPFVELDDAIDHFSSWDLPITSMSFVAHEVPEPTTIALLSTIGAPLLCFIARTRGRAPMIWLRWKISNGDEPPRMAGFFMRGRMAGMSEDHKFLNERSRR